MNGGDYMIVNNNIKDSKLEIWKVKRLLGWLDGLFDTCFLVFIWIMGWKVFFWVYLAIAVISGIGNAIGTGMLEKKL